MIEMRRVTKRFGVVQAVHDLSFTAPGGHIIGLLGQNGAGKTTTLNMLTGYYPPTSGQILVDGKDMLNDPCGCKRCIGYLPERPPLYDEMTVRDYLVFCSRLKQVERRAIRAHVDDILGLCGLQEVEDRVLGNLSKGYRQRAGIAQALCGDPPVLVLDEPTVGLDPKQVVEIRDLIRKLGETHTVLFSSHILAQVQQLCDHVIILHHGRLIRACDINERDSGVGSVLRLRASIAMKERQLIPALRELPCVRRVKVLPSMDTEISEVLLECDRMVSDGGDAQTQLFHLLCALDAPLRMLRPQVDSLEEIFLRATSDGEVTA